MKEFRNGITFNQLNTFKAIYESGNISKASKKLKISAASVSSSLKLLEKSIGQQLFIRTTRAISPTQIGERLYEYSNTAIDQLSSAVDLICDLNETPSGKLSLNMASSIHHVFLKDVLKSFQKSYPHIELNLTLSDTVDDRVEYNIDVGFRYGDRVEDSLIARRIKPKLASGKSSVKVALFVSNEYAQSVGVPQSIDELAAHKQVKYRMPTSRNLAPLRLHKTAEADSEILSIETPTAMVVNDLDVLLDMVADGFGIGMMFDVVLEQRFATGELVPVLEDHWCDIPPIYMYYALESKSSLKVRCFLDYIEQRLVDFS